jgi:hypothetical protein
MQALCGLVGLVDGCAGCKDQVALHWHGHQASKLWTAGLDYILDDADNGKFIRTRVCRALRKDGTAPTLGWAAVVKGIALQETVGTPIKDKQSANGA